MDYSRTSPHPMFVRTFDDLDLALSVDFAGPLWNYLAFGFSPGNFMMSMLCDDFKSAIASAHPSLPIVSLKHFMIWTDHFAPPQSYGSVHKVADWRAMSDETRRDIMIEYKLRPTVFEILSGTEAP